MHLTISQLNIYPIKSLAGITLEEAKVERSGLQYDRRWMLIDSQNVHITQREYPQMALLQPSIDGNTMTIVHKHKAEIRLTIQLNEALPKRFQATVWGEPCQVQEVSEAASAWFSKQLGAKCQLVCMSEDFKRPTDPDHSASTDDHVSFADGYPILIFDEASVNLISEKSGTEIPADRFRGNIITRGGTPHIEDELKRFSINDIEFFGAKTCTRCVLTTINQQTAEKGKEPLKTLATYRNLGGKIKFGLNCIPDKEGIIRVGDPLIIKESVEPIRF